MVTAETMDNSIVVPQSEKYVELRKQEAGFLEYINNSVVMQLDPMNVFECTIFIDCIYDRNALKDYVDSKDKPITIKECMTYLIQEANATLVQAIKYYDLNKNRLGW